MGHLKQAVRILLIAAFCLNALRLLMFVAIIAVSQAQFSVVMKTSPLMFQDFVKYYACGKTALSFQTGHAYDAAAQQDTALSVIGPYTGGKLPAQYKFRTDYPPVVYPLMAPLALLPFHTALLVFLVCSVLSTCAGIFVCCNHDLKQTALWVVAISGCLFSWRTLAMGQMTWVVMGLMSLFFYCLLRLDRKYDVPGGICLAFAALKLQYAAFLLVPVLVLRRWKLLAAAAVPIAALVIVTVAWMGMPLIATYPQVLKEVETTDPYLLSMTCIKSLASLILPSRLLPGISLISMVAGLVTCAAVWKLAATEQKRYSWAAALTVCIALLASPHTQSYDSLLLAVPALLTLTTLDPFRLLSEGNAARRVWSAILFLFPAVSWIVFNIPTSMDVWQICGFMLIFGTLITCGILELRSTAKNEPAPESAVSKDT